MPIRAGSKARSQAPKFATIVTICSVVIGLLASFGLTRGSFAGRETLRALFLTPMIMPVVVLAVALYAFFLKFGLNGTLLGFVIAHLILALPFSIISISNALDGFDRSIEDAAILCGAHPLEAKLRITLPGIRHGLFAAAIFSFLVSWDEVVVAIFMASPTLQTLPVKIWATLRQESDTRDCRRLDLACRLYCGADDRRSTPAQRI